jgi:hypothetical protein
MTTSKTIQPAKNRRKRLFRHSSLSLNKPGSFLETGDHPTGKITVRKIGIHNITLNAGPLVSQDAIPPASVI